MSLYVPSLARYFSGVGGLITLLILLAYQAVLGLLHIGLCHLLAKWFCAGDGHFVQVIRPLLLASIVFIVLAVPIIGALAAGLAWIAVVMMVFEEVHGVEPLTAFLLSAGVGVTLRILQFLLFKSPF